MNVSKSCTFSRSVIGQLRSTQTDRLRAPSSRHQFENQFSPLRITNISKSAPLKDEVQYLGQDRSKCNFVNISSGSTLFRVKYGDV